MIIKLRMKKNKQDQKINNDFKFNDFRMRGEDMAKLSKKVKVRKQREGLLMGIPKAMAQMMELTEDSRLNVTYDNGKLIVEVAKENE